MTNQISVFQSAFSNAPLLLFFSFMSGDVEGDDIIIAC